MVFAAAAAPSAARASEQPLVASAVTPSAPSGRGLEFGARFGVEMPVGDAPGNSALPIWLDLHYRFNPQWALGLFGSISPCSTGCGTTFSQVGLQARHRFTDDDADLWVPWFAAGIGWERYKLSDRTLSGLEFMNLQVGVDRRLADRFGIGPFAAVSIGQFSDDTIPHSYIKLGLKGSFDL